MDDSGNEIGLDGAVRISRASLEASMRWAMDGACSALSSRRDKYFRSALYK